MKIKLSKSQWEQIGKKAGWMKQMEFSTMQQPQLFKDILSLLEEEKRFREHNVDIEEMEEATPEDLDAGYGAAMSSKEFRESLSDVSISIRYLGEAEEPTCFEVIYHGNYGPSSVNAGTARKIVMDSITKEEALQLIAFLKRQSVDVDVMPKAQQQLGL